MKGKFNEIINGKTPVLVDFFAKWCGPCKIQEPILKELASDIKDNARIIKIDIEKNEILAQKYNVKGIPTLILFKNGKIVWRQSGLVQKGQLMQIIISNK